MTNRLLVVALASFSGLLSQFMLSSLLPVIASDIGSTTPPAEWDDGAFEPEWREIDWTKAARDVNFKVRSWCGFVVCRVVRLGRSTASARW